MATVQSILNSARYDLMDYTDGAGVGIEWDDTELLDYLNRMVGLLDSTLSAQSSDLVFATDDSFTTTANLDYVELSTLNSGDWNRIRRVWIKGNRVVEQVSRNYMYYTRKFQKNLLESGSAIASGDYIKIVAQNTLDYTGLGAGDNNNGTYFTASSAGTLGAGDFAWKFTADMPLIWALEGTKLLLPTVAGSVYSLVVHYDKKTAALSLSSSMPFGDRFNEFIREMIVTAARSRHAGRPDRSDQMFYGMFKSRVLTEEIQRGFVPKPYNYMEF